MLIRKLKTLGHIDGIYLIYLMQILQDLDESRLRQREVCLLQYHDDVIKWKHFSRYWPFVRGIHRSPVNSPHKGQWRGALMFSLISTLNKRLSKQLWGWWFETPLFFKDNTHTTAHTRRPWYKISDCTWVNTFLCHDVVICSVRTSNFSSWCVIYSVPWPKLPG